MAQMNGMEKRNFTNSVRNGGKTAEMRNNSAKSGMVGMSANYIKITQQILQLMYFDSNVLSFDTEERSKSNRRNGKITESSSVH